MNHLFPSMPMGVHQNQQPSTMFILSEKLAKAKELTISQLHANGVQGPPQYAVKLSDSTIDVSKLSTPQVQPPQQPRMQGHYTPQQQQMQYFANPPYPVPGVSSPDMPIPQQPSHSESSSKTSSLLSSLSSRAESYLNKSSSLSSTLGLRSSGNNGYLPANMIVTQSTPIATMIMHSFSSRIDVSLHLAHRNFTMAKPDFLSSGHHFDMPLPLSHLGQRRLTTVRWKKEEDSFTGSTTGIRLDVVDTRQTVARYHKKLNLSTGKTNAIEVLLPAELLMDQELVDTVVVTAIAMAKHRAKSEEGEKEAAGEIVSALVGA
ncbi:hypothetical protein OHC33_011026 [Knufia fluminis]|uniref:Uncharacterized protein n=1 Tax=Knufia fluminis TaxID=191047 RepID=A0AAN8EET8_9EURO|nr:hypothetical protein OHC33_011026 [Knufia fluminis]